MLTDSHEVQIEFSDDWEAFVHPIMGHEIFFNVDFEDGIFTFSVAHSSAYYNDRRTIESWVKNSCEKFLFDGTYYLSINDLSLAMWKRELEMASNDENAIEDVLECVGVFYDDIQIELFRRLSK